MNAFLNSPLFQAYVYTTFFNYGYTIAAMIYQDSKKTREMTVGGVLADFLVSSVPFVTTILILVVITSPFLVRIREIMDRKIFQ